MRARIFTPRWFALASATCAMFFAFHAFAQTAPAITGGPSVAESEITDTTAVVRWQTNVESTTVVNFGTTSSLGQEHRKIVPIEETEITESTHSMTLWGLEAGTTYFYQVRSNASGLIVQSAIFQFKTKAVACTADIWSCGEWGVCNQGTDGKYAQSRACTIKEDCPTAETPKPTESQTCLPACTEDIWSCGEWGECANNLQKRTCTLKEDCPTAETPKPTESQACKPACTADMWECSAWSSCSTDGIRTRKCLLKDDCPDVATPKSAESEECESGFIPPQPKPPEPSTVSEEYLETKGIDPESAAGQVIEPYVVGTTVVDDGKQVESPPSPGPSEETKGTGTNLSSIFALSLDASRSLDDECVKNGILPERCAAWLEAKHTDTSCAQAGLFTRESCEKFLNEKGGGVFPGCEGKTDDECAAIKERATLGYLPAEEKKKVDDLLLTRKAAEVFDELGDSAALLIAVRGEKKDEVKWWPSAYTAGKETSPGFIVFDADKDGLPDDLERRLGTDPKKPDLEGTDGGAASRDILKSFFEKGDKPTDFVLVDTDGDGAPDLIEDRNLLGLKVYDPSKTYLVGDSAVYGRMGEQLAIDLDGDGKPDGKVSRDILKSFFEKGDKPTEGQKSKPTSGQFANLIDSVDLAFLRGAPIEQPVAAGETDPSFTVGLFAAAAGNEGGTSAAGGLATDREFIRCRNDKECTPEYPFCRDGYCYGDGRDVNEPQELGVRGVRVKDSDASAGNLLKGRAVPNSTVLVYVYSYVPMVLTTTTDENGNFNYDLADNVVDGKHTVYVAITDETGKITKKSEPLAFFVKGAIAATSEEEFLKPDVNVQPTEAITSYARYYLYGTAILVLVALGFGWRFASRMKGEVKA